MKIFVNRAHELKVLEKAKAGLIVIFGRRRVGKTALVKKWMNLKSEIKNAVYTQAIEGSPVVQIEQIVADLDGVLPKGLHPKTWQELLAAIALIKGKQIITVDEFPYLVRTNPSLPSIIQKWIDHDQPLGQTLVLLGSSQTMMHGVFLDASSPLYERADLIIKVEPMSYQHYCEANSLKPTDMDNFLMFSMMGGIPRYWQYVANVSDVLDVADGLFFGKSARLEDEPDRLLKDEDISGQQAKAIFESIGRGSVKPSEIGARMGIPQTGLSKPLGILMSANLIVRELPFGDSPRNSKKTLYKITDYALRFWYQVYSPHRTRWHHYDRAQKLKLVRDHAAGVLEDEFRKIHLDAARYWEGSNLEFDCVRHAPKHGEQVIVTEIKYREISEAEKSSIASEIKQKFLASRLGENFELAQVEVLGGVDVLRAILGGK